MIHCEVIPFEGDQYRQALELRRRVLRFPLGLDFSEQDLASDQPDTHVAARSSAPGSRVVGTLILKFITPHEIQMRSVAVDPHSQGHGIGRKMVLFAEDWVRGKSQVRRVFLSARVTALPFYEKLGYRICSTEYLSVGIPHFKMEKFF